MKANKQLAVLSPSPRLRAVRLRTVRDCRRELVRLYNCVRRGEMDATTASKMAYLLQTLINTVSLVRQEDFTEDLDRASEGFPEDEEPDVEGTMKATAAQLEAVIARAKRMSGEAAATAFREASGG